MMDSGCGSVGWAVASNTLGPRFDSKSSAKFILSNAYCQLYWKDENKEKRGRECDNLKSIIMMTKWTKSRSEEQSKTNQIREEATLASSRKRNNSKIRERRTAAQTTVGRILGIKYRDDSQFWLAEGHMKAHTYRLIFKQILVIALSEWSLLFWDFITTIAYRWGWYEPSSPVSRRAPQLHASLH